MAASSGASGSIWWAYSWRHLWQHPLRTGLTLVGIALGVAIVLAIQLANHTSLEKFKQSVSLVSGQTDLVIEPTTSLTMDEALLNDVAWVTGSEAFGKFTPLVEGLAVVLPEYIEGDKNTSLPPGQRALTGVSIPVMGVDMAVDAQFRPFTWAEDGKPDDNLAFFHPETIVVTEQLAADYDLKIGSDFPCLINDQPVTLIVSGIMASNGLGQAYNGHLILMDIANSQQLFQQSGQIHAIEIALPQTIPPTLADRYTNRTAYVATVNAQLRETLPDYVTVTTPQLKGQQTEELVNAFQLNLTALSIIALLVAMFLIYNTMSMAMLRRRGDIGTLRTLGLTKRRIFTLYLTEVSLLGVVGSLLGVGLGLLLALVTVKGVASTVEVLYTGLPTVGLTINGWKVLQAFALGVVITILSGAIPVWASTNVPPASATRRGDYERQVNALLANKPWLLPAIAGTAFAGAYWASLQPPIDGFPLFGHACSFLLVLGSALLMPVLLPAIFKVVIKPIVKVVYGWWGDLACRQLIGSLGRTSVAVASLMVAVAMAVSLSVMIHSFRETVHDWVATSITSDIWIEADGRNVANKRRLSPSVVAVISSVEDVAAVDPFLEMPIQYNGQPTDMAIGDFEIFRDYGHLTFLSGDSMTTVMTRAIDHGGVLVTEPFANRHHLTQGDVLELPTPTGTGRFPIAGVYRDFASERGYITMSRKLFQQYWPDTANALTGVAVYVDDGVDAGDVRLAIMQALPASTRLNVMTRQHLRDEIFRIFDNTFAITYALHAIALSVAVLGILNTLLALMLESRREFALFKVLGAPSGVLHRMVHLQAVLLGLLGTVFGVLIGCGLSIYLVKVINVQSFGWTVDMHWPWLLLVETIALMVATAWVVGWFPARVATATLSPDVLRAE